MLALGHVAHPRHQLIGIERLGDVVIHPGQIALGAVRRHALGGEENHRGAAKPFIGAQLLQQAIAIEPRHHHVADHHIGQHLLRLGEAFLPVHRGGHLKAFVFQVGLDRRAQTGLVVHQQQTRGGRRGLCGFSGGGGRVAHGWNRSGRNVWRARSTGQCG